MNIYMPYSDHMSIDSKLLIPVYKIYRAAKWVGSKFQKKRPPLKTLSFKEIDAVMDKYWRQDLLWSEYFRQNTVLDSLLTKHGGNRIQ